MCSHMKVQRVVAFIRKLRFESSVISYGCQTIGVMPITQDGFESSVISYGCQTRARIFAVVTEFESSVISYGCQTLFIAFQVLLTV